MKIQNLTRLKRGKKIRVESIGFDLSTHKDRTVITEGYFQSVNDHEMWVANNHTVNLIRLPDIKKVKTL